MNSFTVESAGKAGDPTDFDKSVIFAVCSGAGAVELPTFEVMGFPITQHQVAVMVAQDVQEQAGLQR